MKSASALEEALDAFRAESCASFCPECPDNCCNGRLNPRLRSIEEFKSLPAVKWLWQSPPREGPYIVDRRTLLGGSRFLAGPCPHFREGACAIFGRPGRPADCRLYPVSLQRPLWGLPLVVMIGAELSCRIFEDEESRRKLEALAASHGVEVVFFPKRSR